MSLAAAKKRIKIHPLYNNTSDEKITLQASPSGLTVREDFPKSRSSSTCKGRRAAQQFILLLDDCYTRD